MVLLHKFFPENVPIGSGKVSGRPESVFLGIGKLSGRPERAKLYSGKVSGKLGGVLLGSGRVLDGICHADLRFFVMLTKEASHNNCHCLCDLRYEIPPLSE